LGVTKYLKGGTLNGTRRSFGCRKFFSGSEGWNHFSKHIGSTLAVLGKSVSAIQRSFSPRAPIKRACSGQEFPLGHHQTAGGGGGFRLKKERIIVVSLFGRTSPPIRETRYKGLSEVLGAQRPKDYPYENTRGASEKFVELTNSSIEGRGRRKDGKNVWAESWASRKGLHA